MHLLLYLQFEDLRELRFVYGSLPLDILLSGVISFCLLSTRQNALPYYDLPYFISCI